MKILFCPFMLLLISTMISAAQDKDAFIRRLDKLAGSHVQEKAREIYLRIYANPVQNLRDSAPFAGR